MPEQTRNLQHTLAVTAKIIYSEWFRRFSSLSQVQRVVTYIRRFADIARKRESSKGYLRQSELDKSLLLVIRLTQRHHFHDLYKSLLTPSKVIPTSFQSTTKRLSV